MDEETGGGRKLSGLSEESGNSQGSDDLSLNSFSKKLTHNVHKPSQFFNMNGHYLDYNQQRCRAYNLFGNLEYFSKIL